MTLAIQILSLLIAAFVFHRVVRRLSIVKLTWFALFVGTVAGGMSGLVALEALS